MVILESNISVTRQGPPSGEHELWRRSSSADTGLGAGSSRLAGENVSIAVTVSPFADVGVAQASLAGDVRGVAGPHHGGEKGDDGELELHVVD
jgi:hypothetical protein